MKQKRGARKFLKILNSKPAIGILIFIMLSLATVFAGDMIFDSGNLNVSSVFYVNESSGSVGIGTAVPEPGFILDVNGSLVLGSEALLAFRNAGGAVINFYEVVGNDLIKIRDSWSVDAITIRTGNRIGFYTTTPSYPLEVNANISGISIYAQDNISARGYITRTSVFDKLKNPWDYIQDSDYYLDGGIINHSRFYGYAGKFISTDYSRPVEKECTGLGCTTPTIIVYPYNKTEEGVLLDKEIDLLRQGVYELKQENELLKTELCKKDNSYGFC